MFSKVFLAGSKRFPPAGRFEYMAVHFSAYGKGLSNIPDRLPAGCIILLDDSTAPEGHDPIIITRQAVELAERFSPYGILLDFQRPHTGVAQDIAQRLVAALPCPVGVTEEYVKALGCPVFLPPLPANKALAEYITPWKKQGVFLEIAPVGAEITVTEVGSKVRSIPIMSGLPLKNERLHCHYRTEVLSDKAVFSICRYKEDLAELVAEAEGFGVLGCVGFHRELVE